MTRLEGILRAEKSALVKQFFPPPDHAGGNSWLWLPHTRANPHVCLVAHIDTVHPRPPRKIYHDPKADAYWSPDGLGADDRAGVCACLTLREHTGCMVLLTDGEERGGVGAREAAALFQKHFGAVKCLVEIDRRGRRQAVFYSQENTPYRGFITGFGFQEHAGSFSDISILSPAWGIPGVNLSAGYYNEHTAAEYLIESHLLDTIRRVKKILKEEKIYEKSEQWGFDASPVYPKFGGYHDAWDIPVYPGRHRQGTAVAGRGAVCLNNRPPRDLRRAKNANGDRYAVQSAASENAGGRRGIDFSADDPPF